MDITNELFKKLETHFSSPKPNFIEFGILEGIKQELCYVINGENTAIPG